MNFFDLFRILFATHFLLGIPVALRHLQVLIFNPLIGVLITADLSAEDAVAAASFGILTFLWYFVWYGSLVFAIKRRFPLLSIRVFLIVLTIVYVGLGSHFVRHLESGLQQTPYLPVLGTIIATMLAIAISGILFLPGLKVAADAEEQRFLEQRDRHLDDLNPWGGVPRSSESRTEP